MMDTQDLEKKIREAEGEGQIPLAVVGTAGTTVLGAFDPLDKLADICQEHNIWFHVDVSGCVCVAGAVCEALLCRQATEALVLSPSPTSSSARELRGDH